MHNSSFYLLVPTHEYAASPIAHINFATADHAGLQLYIVMPDDQADEKKALLEKLGAKVIITPCCAISNKVPYATFCLFFIFVLF